jgi:membrane protein DedA with SNARE-associated domain
MPLVHNLVHVLLHFFYTHEVPTLFVALLTEEAGVPIPIPGDTLLMLAGTQPHKALLSSVLVLAVSSLAVFCGSSLLYLVMRHGGRPFLLKYGKYLHINQHTLEPVEGWFRRYGRKTIIIGRLIPGLRLPITVIAGISGLPPRDWCISAAIAAPVWSAFFYGLGALFGHEGPLVLAYVVDLLETIPKELLAISALLVLLRVAVGVRRLRRLRQRRHAAA